MYILKIMKSVISDHKHLFLINLLGCFALTIGGLTVIRTELDCTLLLVLGSIISFILLSVEAKLFLKNKYRLLPIATWKIYIGSLLGTGICLLLTLLMQCISTIIILGFDISIPHIDFSSEIVLMIADVLVNIFSLFALFILFGVIQQKLEHLWNRLISSLVTFSSFIAILTLIGKLLIYLKITDLGFKLIIDLVFAGIIVGGTIFFIDRYVETKVEAN